MPNCVYSLVTFVIHQFIQKNIYLYVWYKTKISSKQPYTEKVTKELFIISKIQEMNAYTNYCQSKFVVLVLKHVNMFNYSFH